MKPIKTKFTGVFYRESITNEKPDKTYYIIYKDINGKKYEVKIGKFSEGIREVYCHNKRNEIITKQRLGETVHLKHAQKQSITIDNLAAEYFANRIAHNAESGAHEQRRYKNHIAEPFGSLIVENIKLDSIRTFQAEKSKTHAQKTVNVLVDLLSTIIEFGIKNDKVKVQNPVKKIDRFSIDNERERYLTEDEVQKLLSDTKENDFEAYTFCLLALTTGGRLETILAIREFDCDFVNRTVNLKDFKNNSTYKGFLTIDSINAIKAQLKKHGVIFTYSTTTMQKHVNIYLEQFNKKIKPDDRKNKTVIHTLRHTFASHLAINYTPIFTIQKLMNHSDIKMTMRYAKLAPDSGREFIDKLFV